MRCPETRQWCAAQLDPRPRTRWAQGNSANTLGRLSEIPRNPYLWATPTTNRHIVTNSTLAGGISTQSASSTAHRSSRWSPSKRANDSDDCHQRLALSHRCRVSPRSMMDSAARLAVGGTRVSMGSSRNLINSADRSRALTSVPANSLSKELRGQE